MSAENREVLGIGSYGKVYKETIDGKEYAVKHFFSIKVNEIEGFLPEVDMIMRIDHPNVVKGFNFELRGNQGFHFVMELGVSLDKILEDLLSFITRLTYIHNIGSGIDFIMKCGYLHCDLKNPNILVINGIAKLADIGVVTTLDPKSRGSDRDQSTCKTSIYKAPEHIVAK